MRTIATLCVGLVMAVFVPRLTAWAINLPVEYTVDSKTLRKGAPAGTALTFELHTSSGCTAAVHSQVVAVEDVGLIEKLKTQGAKGGPKPPKPARLNHVLSGVTPQAAFYLEVIGTGIAAVGVHAVDFCVPIAKGHEGDLLAVGRPHGGDAAFGRAARPGRYRCRSW